ncbi:hypothetical protein RvY_18996 [Ramazzottius varieornatus]|uniref:Uncharacterized protein n=1 Tax=Ramazzottius varieornatus TaxID=947166 RepID=A0A1D1W7T3_RAMVA|nr:hypothetical protein RvY_18996 [Ramazzottius varieornatus]
MGSCTSCFVLLSMSSSAAACMGFFLPYWIKGQLRVASAINTATFFGSFRRCTFPQISQDKTELVIVNECGRYESFLDVPSVAWQMATLLVGLGVSLSLFASVMSFLACWVPHLWTQLFFRALLALHLAAGLLIVLGICIYPLGWDQREVRDACGNSDKFRLGSCRLYWCYFILIAAGAAEFVLSFSSWRLSPAAYPSQELDEEAYGSGGVPMVSLDRNGCSRYHPSDVQGHEV